MKTEGVVLHFSYNVKVNFIVYNSKNIFLVIKQFSQICPVCTTLCSIAIIQVTVNVRIL